MGRGRLGKTFEVKNPATGATIARVAEGDKADIDLAVRAARRAFESGPWPAMTASERGKIVWRIGDLISKYTDELAELESLDNGKPMAVAKAADVPLAADIFQYMAGWSTKIEGKTIPLSVLYTPGVQYHSYTRPEPIGVVGQIIPWNFPLLMAAWKLAPALATGCTVVLKVAEETPLSALRLGEILQEAGLPAGVVNIVTGFGETAGAALAAHPGVDKVAFTGSTEVGRLIVQAAARDLKQVSLELGGKSPNIVLEDADLDVAIPGAASAIFFNHGQCCCAGSRLYVHERLFDKVVAGVSDQAKAIKLGPGLDPETQMGPMVSETQRDRVCGYLESGKKEGARAMTGGKAREGSGYFVEPTVFVDTKPNMKIVKEEIFGPVVTVSPFKQADDALVREANDTHLRSGGGDLDARHQQGTRARRASPGRNRVDQLLQHLRCGAAVRRLQAVRLGPRDGRGGARELPGYEGRDYPSIDCVLKGEETPLRRGLLLAQTSSRSPGRATSE